MKSISGLALDAVVRLRSSLNNQLGWDLIFTGSFNQGHLGAFCEEQWFLCTPWGYYNGGKAAA